MQVNHKPTKILIVGKSGSGKSTYQTRFVASHKFTRTWIFDHKTEFAKRNGYPMLLSFEEVAEAIKKGESIICYHHTREYPGDGENAFQDFCSFVYEFSKELEEKKEGSAGNSLFVCDEINRFTTTSDLGDAFKCVIEDGRLYGIDFIGTSHASNQISNRLRLQLSEIVALKTIDPRPLQFLEECGFDPGEVSRLATGEFICKDLNRDIFVRGKLFTCKERGESVEAEEEPTDLSETSEPQENYGTLSQSTSNDQSIHG